MRYLVLAALLFATSCASGKRGEPKKSDKVANTPKTTQPQNSKALADSSQSKEDRKKELEDKKKNSVQESKQN